MLGHPDSRLARYCHRERPTASGQRPAATQRLLARVPDLRAEHALRHSDSSLALGPPRTTLPALDCCASAACGRCGSALACRRRYGSRRRSPRPHRRCTPRDSRSPARLTVEAGRGLPGSGGRRSGRGARSSRACAHARGRGEFVAHQEHPSEAAVASHIRSRPAITSSGLPKSAPPFSTLHSA